MGDGIILCDQQPPADDCCRSIMMALREGF
jgi:hypothetical protein